MRKNSRTRFKLHWFKGVEMDAPANKALIHYVGTAIVICSVAALLHVIRWW